MDIRAHVIPGVVTLQLLAAGVVINFSLPASPA